MTTCPSCSMEIPETANVCGFCGHRIREHAGIAAGATTAAPPSPPVDPAVADAEVGQMTETTGHPPEEPDLPRRAGRPTVVDRGRGPLTPAIWDDRAVSGSLLVLGSLALPWLASAEGGLDRLVHTPTSIRLFGPAVNVASLLPGSFGRLLDVGIILSYVLLLLGVAGMASAFTPKHRWVAPAVGLATIVLTLVYLGRPFIVQGAPFDLLVDVLVDRVTSGPMVAIVGGLFLLTGSPATPVTAD